MTKDQVVSALAQHGFSTQAAELASASDRSREQMALIGCVDFLAGYQRAMSRYVLFCDARGQAEIAHRAKLLELLERGIVARLDELNSRAA